MLMNNADMNFTYASLFFCLCILSMLLFQSGLESQYGRPLIWAEDI